MRLREIINLARGFRFLRVFVELIQTELRGLEDCNFILLKASLFNKGLPFRARPSQSGLPSVSPVISIGPFPRAWSTFPASRDPKLTPKALGFRSDPPKQNLDGLA